jgi:predicted acetyltransferase
MGGGHFMDGFRKLEKDEIPSFARIAVNAYPGFRISSEEDIAKYAGRLQRHVEVDPRAYYFGLFRSGSLAGGFCMYDYFTLNLLGTRVKAGGVGNLGVDLTHKKEKVARDIMLATLRHFREKGISMVTLYPFRPDFYRKMGFGYGTTINRYTLRPADLPTGGSKEHVEFLTRDDIEGIHACYMRYFDRTSGMMAKPAAEMATVFDNPQIKVVGCKRDGTVTAYMLFSFKKDTQGRFLVNDLVVRELICDASADLLEMMTFLRSQADQIRKVVIDTQEEYFHYLPVDPRDGSDEMIPSVYHVVGSKGVGMMYKVVDIPGMFHLLGSRNFGDQTCGVKLTIRDSFQPENDGSVIVHFAGGLPTVKSEADGWDVQVTMDVAEFSSLLMGAVDFSSLHRYGLAVVSDEKRIATLDRLFRAPKPVCLTAF